MIDNIPGDVPQAIFKFVDKNLNSKSIDINVKYITQWNKQEVYIVQRVYYPYKTGLKIPRVYGLPVTLIYDCKDARMATTNEMKNIINVKPTAYFTSDLSQRHFCSEDQ